MRGERIGIAGYMGAGKSTGARVLARHGAVVVDADAAAKELMRSDRELRSALTAAFGAGVVSGGKVDFPYLGERAFGSLENLMRLNTIVHPPLLRRLAVLCDRPDARVAVLDAALIPLWGIESWFSRLIWVRADRALRLDRMAGMTDCTTERLRRRMELQEALMTEPQGPPWDIVPNGSSPGEFAEKISELCSGGYNT